jgi:hypothetical protein
MEEEEFKDAQQRLKGGLLSSTDFISKYGQDKYNSTIGVIEAVQETNVVEAEPEGAGFFGTLADMGEGILNGIEGAINETAQTVNSAGEWMEDKLGTGRLVWEDNDGDGKADSMIPTYWDREKVVANKDKLDQDILTKAMENINIIDDERETMIGGFTEGISQFVTGFVALGGAKTFVGAMLKGGIVDATVFDPYEANISSLIEDSFLANPITEALAMDVDAPEWENRLRNSIEGGITGLALEGIIKGVKFHMLGGKAKAEIKKLGKVSDETAAKLDETHAELTEIETQKNKPEKLVVNDDGTAKAPDGTKFKADEASDDLVEVPKTEAEIKAENELNAKTAEALAADDPAKAMSELDIPDAKPKADVETKTSDEVVSEILQAQVEPKIIKPKAKVPLIKKEDFEKALSRAFENGDTELVSIEDGAFFNSRNMNQPIEAAKILEEFTTVLRESKTFKKMKLDKPQTLDDVHRGAIKYIADASGTNPNNIIKELNITETITRDLSEKIVAGKFAIQSMSDEVGRLSKEMTEKKELGTLTEVDENKFVDMMQTTMEVVANVKSLQTSAARATSAGRVVTDNSLGTDFINRVDMFGGSEKVRNLAKELAKVTNGKQRTKTIFKAAERKWLRVLNEYWINSILSGPTTHMLNMTSNSVNLMLRPTERAIGAVMGGNLKEAKTAMKMYTYYISNFSDAIQLAARSGYNMKPILDESVKVDNAMQGNNPRAISSEYLGVKSGTLDILGKALTIPSRMLGAEDEFFKQLSYRSHLQAKISTDAAYMDIKDIQKAGFNNRREWIEDTFEKAFVTKIDAEEAWSDAVITRRVIDDPKVKEKFIENAIGSANKNSSYSSAALLEARQATFTQPLEKGSFSGNFQGFVNKHPLMRQLTPFIQTPMNILNQAIDRTPAFNLLRKQYKDEWNNADPSIRAQARGKMAMGIAIYGTLSALALNNKLTGGGPTDPKLAKLWRESKDWQPYSINFGTDEKPYWVSYARLDPWTTSFGIVADINEMIVAGQMADNDATDMMAMFVAAAGNNIVSKTYLQGISDTVSLMNSKDSPWEIENFFKQRMASLLPLSSLTNQTNNMSDEYLRDTRSYLDKLKKQSGIGRDGLTIKYSWIDGQPLDTPDRLKGFVHITKKGLEEKDVGTALINKEMRKLGYRFQGATRKVKGVELTADQVERWNQLMGSMKSGSRTLNEKLQRVIKSKKYNKDGEDYGLVSASESHRVALLNREIKRYRDKALRQLMKEYPVIREQTKAYRKFLRNSQRNKPAVKPETILDNLSLD